MVVAKKKVYFYKITGLKGEPLHGGSGNWYMPTGKKTGKWMQKVEDVASGHSGYHLVKAAGIVDWLPYAGRIGLLWEAEGRGKKDAEGPKTAFAQARLIKLVGVLDEISMRLAAADMAERVLPIFLKACPGDDRPAKAIQTARDFALGKVDAAAKAAAGGAADAAAWAAAWAAARAAAWAAAGAAVGADAGAAAKGAAWAAVGAAAAWAAVGADAGAAAKAANAKIIIAQARKRAKEVIK